MPNLCSAFGIFMLRQFFRTLPIELEEAARIDGASRLGVLFKIVLPLSVPALATLAMIPFLWTWNDFLWPLIIIDTASHMTLQLGLSTFQGAHRPVEPADGRHRDEPDAGADRVLPRAALVHPLDRVHGAEGLDGRGRARTGDEGVPRRHFAVDDLSLEIADGEFMILVGPSGCGKTTALRMIAGLEKPTSGEIRIGDRVVNDVSPRDRDIAMVFQNYALYPHMTVQRNLAFALRQRRMPRREIDRRVQRGRRDARAWRDC